MRKSLMGIEFMVVKGKKYNGLPDELEPFYAYLRDAGHSIMCVPFTLKAEADQKRAEYWNFECPVPVKYVLKHAHIIMGDYCFIEAKYSMFTGIDIEEKYYEY